ncbi:hypothetical protein JCM11251_005740 [Rhodosporidiobolus azoricus]
MTAKYPSTLSSNIPEYVDGLVDRLKTNLLPVLKPYFEQRSVRRVLELSSGSGIHAALYAKTWPDVLIQPTECDEWGCEQIDEMVEKEKIEIGRQGKDGAEVEKAVMLDVLEETGWKNLRAKAESAGEGERGLYDLVLGSNFLHMVPFPDGPRAIFSNLRLLVSPDAKFLVYGPFKSDEGFFSQADEAFDASIRSRENGSSLGLRSIDKLSRLAEEEEWLLEERISMPKMNWVLVFGRKRRNQVL